MKIIENKIIPFKGFSAINLFGFLFVRKGSYIDAITINHEMIHTEQMKEMGYIFFYIWYFIEWIVRLFMKGNAYRNISFEREAYSNEKDMKYLDNRYPHAWVEYVYIDK